MTTHDAILTVTEVAAELRCSKAHIHNALNGEMAGVSSGKTKDHRDSALSPEMKSWIDNCLVPILIKEYLAESQNAVATPAILVAESNAESTLRGKVSK